MIGVTKPHTFHPPRDMRHSVRSRQSNDGQDNANQPGAPAGPVSARDAYIYSQMSGMTTVPNGTHGLIKTATHDTDPGGGLHTGSLNDRPVRSGGYGSMSAKDAIAFHQQHGADFDKMSPEEQARWAPPPNPNANGNGGNASAASPAQGKAPGPAGVGGISHYTTPGQVPAAPVAAATATDAGETAAQATDAAGTDFLSLLGSSTPNMGLPYRPTDPQASASSAPAPTPQDPAPVQRAMRDAAQIETNGTIGTGAGGYGKTGQIASPDAAQDTTTADAAGNRHIDTAGGGTVDIPALQPQTAPEDTLASNGAATGIYRDGIEQRKQSDGSFAPTQLADSPAGNTPAARIPSGAMVASNGGSGASPASPEQPGDEEDEEGSPKAFFPLKNPYATGGKSGGSYT